jgi:hypothetical protein
VVEPGGYLCQLRDRLAPCDLLPPFIRVRGLMSNWWFGLENLLGTMSLARSPVEILDQRYMWQKKNGSYKIYYGLSSFEEFVLFIHLILIQHIIPFTPMFQPTHLQKLESSSTLQALHFGLFCVLVARLARLPSRRRRRASRIAKGKECRFMD